MAITLSPTALLPHPSTPLEQQQTAGADQFDRSQPAERRQLESFFSWFYWAINIGALVSFTLVASICQFGVSWLGGKEYRFVAGFAIPVLATAAAIVVFLAGSPRYKKRPPKGSILTTASKVVAEAAVATFRSRANRSHSGLPSSLLGGEEGTGVVTSWLDRAKRAHGGRFADGDVEGVKYVARLLPFLLFLMPYWVRGRVCVCLRSVSDVICLPPQAVC